MCVYIINYICIIMHAYESILCLYVFIHSLIMSISVPPLQGGYSELQKSFRFQNDQKGKFLDEHRKS